MSGTGRLADDLYLVAHNDITGKPHLQPRALGLGLAGELVLRCPIRVWRGLVIPSGGAAPSDALTHMVLGEDPDSAFAALVRVKTAVDACSPVPVQHVLLERLATACPDVGVPAARGPSASKKDGQVPRSRPTGAGRRHAGCGGQRPAGPPDVTGSADD